MHVAEELFLDFSIRKLEQTISRIEEVCRGLSREQFWLRTGEHSNSAGNLVLHLAGNVRQWILHGIAGQADLRRREAEFAARDGDPGAVLEALRHTLGEAVAVLRDLSASRLTERIRVQVFEVTVLEGVYHVVEHFSLHAGQIFFLAKQFTNKDLGFYRYLHTKPSSSGVITP